MKNKLYYTDPYLTTFQTTVEQIGYDHVGFYIVLTETAFYATGGGQPYDTGTIDTIPVLQVEEVGGQIRHYLADQLPANTKFVVGHVQWERRFDHMQQHAAQHILSRAFVELFQIDTVSFHLGSDICTIDIDTEALDEKTALEAETLANNIVFENRPITPKWVTTEDLKDMPLRKQPTVSQNIRIVVVEDFDYNACGGIHPAHTGEVGPIKILSWEKHKQKIRLTFVAGKRTVATMSHYQQIVSNTASLLKTNHQNILSKVETLLQKEVELATCKEQLLRLEAKTYIQQQQETITAAFSNRSIQELQQLATFITREKQDALICFVTKNNHHLQFILTKGKDLSIPIKDIGQQLLTIINGKGGGNDLSIRGGGETDLSGEEFIHQLLCCL